jgi:hypothetical protein
MSAVATSARALRAGDLAALSGGLPMDEISSLFADTTG